MEVQSEERRGMKGGKDRQGRRVGCRRDKDFIGQQRTRACSMWILSDEGAQTKKRSE